MSIREDYENFEKSKRIYLKADKDTAERLNITIGEEYSIFPEPKNIKEAFERLEKYNGLIILESLIDDFKKTYPINHRTVSDKLKIINDFIDDAEKINLSEAVIKVADNHPKSKQYEYLKLKYDFYKNENLEFHGFNYFFGPLVVLVYSEYFLFKEWLENELIKLNKPDSIDDDKIKIVYTDKIKAAEDLAKSTFEFSLKQDLFDIESKKVSNETHKELLKNYYSNIISNYLNIRNLYKASNEQFHFLNNEAENQLTEDDRIDFIATVLCGYLVEGNQEDSNIVESDLIEIFNQLKNIDELIYETKLAELKFNVIKKLVEKIEKEKINSTKDYPIINDAWEINKDFVEEIRLQYSTSKLLFGCKEDELEIVPKIQTHDYLRNNFNIDENILRNYFEPTRNLISDLDFEKMVNIGYMGDIDRTLNPYIIQIFGAYHARKKIHSQLSFLLFDKIKYFINNKEIKFLSDLVPYFIDYSEGFKIGFNDFEKNCITPFLNEYSDKSDFTFKVFEYVTKNIAFDRSWFNNNGSFSYSSNINDYYNKKIINSFEDGQKQGHFYKAWSIILGNSKVYAPLFEEHYSINKVNNKEVFTLDENHNDKTNDFEKSSIEDYLEQFKDLISNNTYDLFVDAYLQYFSNGKFPSIDKKIIFKKMNKKRLGWELKELYKSLKTDSLDVEYFRFAQQNINLFKDEIIEEVNFNKSKFYKLFTTKV